MLVLLEINPSADKDMALAVGVEEGPGVPATVMNSLGSEKVINRATLNSHYDALGSYLHVQSMKQVRAGILLNTDKIRSRCKKIVAFIQGVLSSRVYNVTLGAFSKIICLGCEKPIRKRLLEEKEEMQVECFECRASYTIVDKKNGEVVWKPNQHELECANSKCKIKIFVWSYEIENGSAWICQKCKGRNVVALCIRHDSSSTPLGHEE